MREPYHDYFRLKLNRGIYQVVFRDRPDRQVSTGTGDKTEAISWAYEHMDAPPSRSIRLAEFARDLFVPGRCPYARRMEKRKQTFSEDYYPDLRGWKDRYIIPRWGGHTVSSIRKRPVEEWLFDVESLRADGRTLSNESKNKIINCFRKIMDEALDVGLIKENPITRLTLFPPDGDPREPFELE